MDGKIVNTALFDGRRTSTNKPRMVNIPCGIEECCGYFMPEPTGTQTKLAGGILQFFSEEFILIVGGVSALLNCVWRHPVSPTFFLLELSHHVPVHWKNKPIMYAKWGYHRTGLENLYHVVGLSFLNPVIGTVFLVYCSA